MSSCAIAAIVIAVLAIPMLGVISALAIYGVRRYLGAAKTSEAKNTIGAISRGATAAYERESPAEDDPDGMGEPIHSLCGSAAPVPASVPAGTRYQPDLRQGYDYETGDDQNGWRCLKFGLTGPHYYQYHYYRDASVVAPASPLACKGDCYEAGAMGDLDADGISSRFARTGQIDPTSGRLKASTQIYIENEFE